MLGLLCWQRPFERKSGNVINIVIQVVRVISVVCILVFVEELGIAQTTQTVTGMVLIVVQSVLTGVLAILIAVNAIILCCKENPHRKRRKELGKSSQTKYQATQTNPKTEELEKLNREDTLTPLDAHNDLLSNPSRLNPTNTSSIYSQDSKHTYNPQNEMNDPANPYSGRQYNTQPQHRAMNSFGSQTNLMVDAAPAGRSISPAPRGNIPWAPSGATPDNNGGYRGMAY